MGRNWLSTANEGFLICIVWRTIHDWENKKDDTTRTLHKESNHTWTYKRSSQLDYVDYVQLYTRAPAKPGIYQSISGSAKWNPSLRYLN